MDNLQYESNGKRKGIGDRNVLNLVINGWPSIRKESIDIGNLSGCFKPCYKWMTFNTLKNNVIL